MSAPLGLPRLHLRSTGSTNDHAKALALDGAPHGTLVTTAEQVAGRGRQGRTWATVPAGHALAVSLILREHDALLSLRAGLAAADVAGPAARIKWPNDVLLEERKVAGVLVERRPQDGWAVLGIGLNHAVGPADFPPEVRDRAGGLGREPSEGEAVLRELLDALAVRLAEPVDAALNALRARDALLGREVVWANGRGTGAGIGAGGALMVDTDGGERVVLQAGEVHLGAAPKLR